MAAKEPWQMSQGDFLVQHNGLRRLKGKLDAASNQKEREQYSAAWHKAHEKATNEHRMAVESAVSRGDSVPTEALKMYPHLDNQPDDPLKP